MIYFIKCNDLVKIGYSNKNPQKRLSAMQTGNPYELELITTEPGDYLEEAQLHHQFRHLHVRGEWFEFKDELTDYLNTSIKPIEPNKDCLLNKDDSVDLITVKKLNVENIKLRKEVNRLLKNKTRNTEVNRLKSDVDKLKRDNILLKKEITILKRTVNNYAIQKLKPELIDYIEAVATQCGFTVVEAISFILERALPIFKIKLKIQ